MQPSLGPSPSRSFQDPRGPASQSAASPQVTCVHLLLLPALSSEFHSQSPCPLRTSSYWAQASIPLRVLLGAYGGQLWPATFQGLRGCTGFRGLLTSGPQKEGENTRQTLTGGVTRGQRLWLAHGRCRVSPSPAKPTKGCPPWFPPATLWGDPSRVFHISPPVP